MKIAIIGAGIAGLSTAIALEKAGYEATIYEAAPQIKAVGAGLTLAANAMQALERLGIADEIIKEGRSLPYFQIRNHHGKVLAHTDSFAMQDTYGIDNFVIHRAALHQILQESIIKSEIHTNKKLKSITQDENQVYLDFTGGTSEAFDILIAADGIHSAVRKQLLPNTEFRYAGYTCWRAIVDMPNDIHEGATETWGSNGRFGLVPLANKQLYWFACINAAQSSELHKNFKVKDLKEYFAAYSSDILSALDATNDKQLIWNDIIDLKPLDRYAYGRCLLVGDAAHATTPNMGQGACQALEDAVVLGQEMGKYDYSTAFSNFEKRRTERCKWIVNQSEKFGKIAQWENPFAIKLRNSLFSILPKSTQKKQFEKLYQVDF